jgi:hypothetical protein
MKIIIVKIRTVTLSLYIIVLYQRPRHILFFAVYTICNSFVFIRLAAWVEMDFSKDINIEKKKHI